MSTIYAESDLIANRSYKVQDVSHIRDAKRFIGLSALFKQVSNTTASVRITSTMQYVPVRCLIFVKGFVAKSVQAKNAEGFAIIAQNGLGIPVGRAYLNPTSVTDTHAVFDIEGKEVTILLNEFISPGKYEVQFDGGNFSSGVYFFSIVSGNFLSTKKLVLVK